MTNGNTPNRSLLGFQEAVNMYFDFLVKEYGYQCVHSDPYFVKFTSEKVYFNVFHERISFEIYFRIGILPEDSNNTLEVSLNDILMNMDSVNGKSFFQASNKNAVNTIVKELANLVKLYAKDLIRGSYIYFQSLVDKRIQWQKKALLTEELNLVEDKAKEAWNNKDYDAVIEAYDPYQSHLNSIQLKKLNLAKKKLNEEN